MMCGQRALYGAAAVLFALNGWLNPAIAVPALLGAVFAAALTLWLPRRTAAPPPPPAAPSTPPPALRPVPQRETAVCSGCGRAVDATWTMCPYCSHRISM